MSNARVIVDETKKSSRHMPVVVDPALVGVLRHGIAYSMHGAGAHACVGMQLANMEMKVFWHELLTSCRFALADDYEGRHTHTPLGCVSGAVGLKLEPLLA
jgi:cytochrome P450